jgi:D-glycero-alpha-D-manno-heptose-7-phosphate kinase
MILVKAPFRVSFFGGSTDYADFYEQHGSFIFGCTINKYAYLSIRNKPKILSEASTISYSKFERVKNLSDIENPLIRETLKYFGINGAIEFISFSDIPSRTGLGGSSSYCVGMSHLLRTFLGKNISKNQIARDAIEIERNILKESGGIQDQIWAAYGGLNTIEIRKNGNFFVKPLPITNEFRDHLRDSMVLIYSNEQRVSNNVAKSHENKDKTPILKLAHEAYSYLLSEDIKSMGTIMYDAWLEKAKISSHVSTKSVDSIISTCMNFGAYGAKLLGAGGCGFVLVLCDPSVKQKISEIFVDNILEFDFDYNGACTIFNNSNEIPIR